MALLTTTTRKAAENEPSGEKREARYSEKEKNEPCRAKERNISQIMCVKNIGKIDVYYQQTITQYSF